MRRWLILLIVLAETGMSGCATQSSVQIQEPFTLGKHRAIRIEPCIDRTGFTGKSDLSAEATSVLTEKLRAATLFDVTSDANLVLTCDIERFAEGSALKRWAQGLVGRPGWGATLAAVAVIVWESPGDKMLTTFRSQSSVKTGGLYSIGADRYIMTVVFDDIVRQLKAWTEGSHHQYNP